MTQDLPEQLDPPRTRTLSFYMVLLFIVGPLWSMVPLSWAFVVYTLRSGSIWSFGFPGRALFCVALCEVFFSIHHYRLAQKVSKSAPLGAGDLAELQAAFTRVLKAGLADLPVDGFDEESLDVDRPGSPAESIVQLQRHDPRAIDFRNVLRNWFGRVPWSRIRQGEVHPWLYWSIFNTHMPTSMDALPHSQRTALEEALDLLQKRSGCKISDGSDPTVKPMMLTLDKVNISLRPFAFYVLVAVVNWGLKEWYRRTWDVCHGSYRGLEYLLRVPKNWNSSTGPRPIIFIHGLGLGLFQYHSLLSHLLQTIPDRPILFPLQPHVSQDIFHPRYLQPLGRHETVNALADLLNILGWVDKRDTGLDVTEDEDEDEDEQAEVGLSVTEKAKKGVTMMSHSNGSYFHAWVLKAFPKMVTRSCFVDPVTFCSWEGDTCYNFIYRTCKTGMEVVVRYFVGTELGVANLLQRRFDWSSNALWYEDIPNARDPAKTMFVLGGKDAILNAERVKRYLRSHGVRKGLWFDPNGRHGQALIRGGEGHTEILRWLKERD